MRLIAILAGFALFPISALAKPPADIADLVGARAAGAESEMEARGYENVQKNDWWNGSNCVRVHVSQGRYKSIDTLKPSACGQNGGSAKACPPDVSEADRYKYPSCN